MKVKPVKFTRGAAEPTAETAIQAEPVKPTILENPDELITLGMTRQEALCLIQGAMLIGLTPKATRGSMAGKGHPRLVQPRRPPIPARPA